MTDTWKRGASQFLTPHEVGSDNWVWALVSDKTHSVPVRFSKQAMKTFEGYEKLLSFARKSIAYGVVAMQCTVGNPFLDTRPPF